MESWQANVISASQIYTWWLYLIGSLNFFIQISVLNLRLDITYYIGYYMTSYIEERLSSHSYSWESNNGLLIILATKI